MDIVAPYPNFNLLSDRLKEEYNFDLNHQWSGKHLQVPEQMGDGIIHIYSNRGLQFFRGNWNMKQDTFFSSPNLVGAEKLVDFRINSSGEVRSAFLEKQKKYEWDITKVNGIRILIPEDFLLSSEPKLVNKFQSYCLDGNINRLTQELLTLYPSNFIDCIKMEWKFLELAYYWLEFLNKKDIARHFFDIPGNQVNALHNAKQWVENNLFNPFTIKDLSKKVGLNEQYLKQGFKRLFGYTIRQFIIKLKMEKAKEMVLYQNYSINEISCKLGYSNHGYFAKIYHKFHGLSPLKHRISINGNQFML